MDAQTLDIRRFVGRWASEAANCEARAWRFTADSELLDRSTWIEPGWAPA